MSRTKDSHSIIEAWGYAPPNINGLFSNMRSILDENWPWTSSVQHNWHTPQDTTLDLDYFYNHSGDKPAAAGIEKILVKADADVIPNIPYRNMLCSLILGRFYMNWKNRWNALVAEYDPLENYSMKEDLTNDDTTVTHGKTTTRTGSVDLTPETVMTVESSVYAYDSGSPSPDAKTVSTPEGSDTTEYNDLTDTEGGTTKTEHDYTKTLSGNIGVTTSQQMLEAELEIRKYDFFQSVYEDIDKVLTCPVY